MKGTNASKLGGMCVATMLVVVMLVAMPVMADEGTDCVENTDQQNATTDQNVSEEIGIEAYSYHRGGAQTSNWYWDIQLATQKVSQRTTATIGWSADQSWNPSKWSVSITTGTAPVTLKGTISGTYMFDHVYRYSVPDGVGSLYLDASYLPIALSLNLVQPVQIPYTTISARPHVVYPGGVPQSTIVGCTIGLTGTAYLGGHAWCDNFWWS
ncbi:MAG: hypothetical protein PHH26_02840 [Candidatus Thermoplasmatota archaeon]|nr:hypothetical protein [Candidatus Thermoplasmatota archaeon]